MANIEYEVKEHFGIISQSAKGWRKEVNLISWNSLKPKLDVRDWAPERTKMGKGITLSHEEAEALYYILKDVLKK